MDHARKPQEIIVIGAGLGGLTSAALLARAGVRVRVLESAQHAGGRARSRDRDGFTLNVGPHALFRRGPAEQVLRDLGVPIQGKVVGATGVFGLRDDKLHELPFGPLSMLRTDLLSGSEKLELLRVLAGLGEKKALAVRGLTVNQWLEQAVKSGRTRAVLAMLVRLSCYAYAHDMLGADVAVRQVAQVARHSVMYLDGGWQSLVEPLRAQLGAAIELGVSVQRIEQQAGKVSAVLTSDGRRLPANHVIAALELPALARLLPGDALVERWARAAVPLRAACIDLGVRELPHPERRSVQALDAPLYFSNHSAYARLAPAGCHLLGLVHYLAPGEDGRASEPLLRAFLERVQPGVWERAVVKRFMPNLIVHNDLPSPERARRVHPEIAGLSLVSDVSSARFMLADAVLDSARAAVQDVLAAEHVAVQAA
jgi:phytoene dehydrogenase-like protein